jgi:[pyruvate, water dikinase]-phosphate phosphotransferase / [pyruvate, water dikinase] kinase
MSDIYPDPAPSEKLSTYFHLHLVSDATGETLNAVAKAAIAQFDSSIPIEHTYALVRTTRHLDRVLSQIEDMPGIVIYTLVNYDLRDMLEQRCAELQLPCLSVLDPVIQIIGTYLGAEISHRPGGQHSLTPEYFQRIEALQYTMAHDDGQLTHELHAADVVLLGVSRTSKTPTCIYLANRGLKAANIPVVPNIPLPDNLAQLRKPLIVGLTTNPDRLVQVRRNRLLQLHEKDETTYTNMDLVVEEVRYARRLYAQNNWPVIDVTRRSIEETAAAIMNLLSNREVGKGNP